MRVSIPENCARNFWRRRQLSGALTARTSQSIEPRAKFRRQVPVENRNNVIVVIVLARFGVEGNYKHRGRIYLLPITLIGME